MTHVVKVAVTKFYKVFVPDTGQTGSDQDVMEQAKQMVLDDPDCLVEDEGADMEPQDVKPYAHYMISGDTDGEND